jgi:ABC-type lipoprotein release transport system permease subunit
MLAFKLAFKNLIGARLRTWLNVAVLSFAFVLIIFYNGILDGWNMQGSNDTQNWEIGGGQFWHPAYDKFDPFTIHDSHGLLSEEVKTQIQQNNLTPILITQANIYPQGRMMSVVLKGIDPNQQILALPSNELKSVNGNNFAIIGTRMSKMAKLKAGDKVLLRWRDKFGAFDASEFEIATVFKCDVPAVDYGQLWLPLETLQKMTGLENEATLLVKSKDYEGINFEDWEFKNTDFLLKELKQIIKSKKGGASILQGMLLIIALLAIFDTQVLSIFRRQKEIGTYIALGMTRKQVVGIFTVEGGAHSILAALVGAVYGIPLFLFLNKVGISFGTNDYGLTIAETIYPYYSLKLIVTSVLLVVISATVVSYIPARKISKMKPTDALKGKLQ